MGGGPGITPARFRSAPVTGPSGGGVGCLLSAMSRHMALHQIRAKNSLAWWGTDVPSPSRNSDLSVYLPGHE
jgi:hypothetical protein